MSAPAEKPKVLQNYTMEETASQLAVSRRWLADFVKDHPHYTLAGHRKLFTASHILLLHEAMQIPKSPRRHYKPQIYYYPTPEETHAELMALLEKPPRGPATKRPRLPPR